MATMSAERPARKKSSKSSSKTKNSRISTSGSKMAERTALQSKMSENSVLQVSEEKTEEPTDSGSKMAESTVLQSKMAENSVLQVSEEKTEEPTDSAGQAQSPLITEMVAPPASSASADSADKGSKMAESTVLQNKMAENSVLQVSEEKTEEPTDSAGQAQSYLITEMAAPPASSASADPADKGSKMAESTALQSKMLENSVLQVSEEKTEEPTDSAGQARSPLVLETAATPASSASANPADKGSKIAESTALQSKMAEKMVLQVSEEKKEEHTYSGKMAEYSGEPPSEAAMATSPDVATVTNSYKPWEMAAGSSMQPWDRFDDTAGSCDDNACKMAGGSIMQTWEKLEEAVGSSADNAWKVAAGSPRNPWANYDDTEESRADNACAREAISISSSDVCLQEDLDSTLAASLAASQDDDVFEDALDEDYYEFTQPKTFSLLSSFDDCNAAMQKFFDNDIQGAMAIMKPLSSLSMYHSLAMAIFVFIPAILTFDKEPLQKATRAIKNCVRVCDKYRKTYSFAQSLGAVLKKPKYADYTEMQAHAELCHAEVSLLQAALTIAEGDDYASYISAVFKLKSSFRSYKICWEIKEAKRWESEVSQTHFESGVRLGTATFNLIISLLPPQLITLLEFVGFSGSRMYGINELKKGARSPGLRSVLCELMLLVYYLIIIPFTGGQGNVEAAELIFQTILVTYPNSVWLRTLRARSEFLKGRLKHSISAYKSAMNINHEYKQFKILCHWEIMWAHGLNLEFEESAMYAQLLFDDSAWSKTTHLYIKAAMLMQIDEHDVTSYHRDSIANAMLRAPLYKTRVAGKSLPMEKFIVRRCERYYRQGHQLVLPAFELLNYFNKLHVLTKNKDHLAMILRIIQETRALLVNGPKAWMGAYVNDNLALVYYLHACALCATELPVQAMSELLKVMEIKNEIKEDTFLIPYAKCEMALAYFQMGNMQAAMEQLYEVKKKYSGYPLEMRLQFRVQAREELVRTIIGDSKFTPGVKGIQVETHYER